MFKLEKVFQNDDLILINIYILINSLLVFFSIYIIAILENNYFYDFTSYKIFEESYLYEFTFLITIIFFISQYFVPLKKRYIVSYLNFFKTTFIYFLFSYVLSSFIILYFILNFFLSVIFFYIFILCFLFLIFNKFLFNNIYRYLIYANIIQRNILLVGNKESILYLNKKKIRNKINIYKCCLIDIDDENLIKKFKQEIKIPVFTFTDDPRIILEYHQIGQIWILYNGNEDQFNKYFDKIIDYPVDILKINIFKKLSLNENLSGDAFEYELYSISNFYGIKFFIKIFLDKILSLIFLFLTLPIIAIFSLFIYFEDGFPILFKQERTGWDGRRFSIYKLRSLKNIKFDKTIQVMKNDPRLLKVGKFIRKFSIDELPQFFNVLKGDMSIVGPRPHMVLHDLNFSKVSNKYYKRSSCLPGLTGWAQVNGLRGATPTEETIKKRMEYDLWYLNNWNIFLDLYIIIKTFYAVFRYRDKI